MLWKVEDSLGSVGDGAALKVFVMKCCPCLKGNCSENFLLQNIFGFHVYITNIYVKLSTETVIMQKNNVEQF